MKDKFIHSIHVHCEEVLNDHQCPHMYVSPDMIWAELAMI